MTDRTSLPRRVARWLVIAAAGLASIATSPARWFLAAQLPAGAPSATRGELVTIEASLQPSVSRRTPGREGQRTVVAQEKRPWNGRATYYLPPGTELASVTVSSVCTSGGMCSACEPPPGAFVRVAKVERVEPWALEATTEEQTARIDPLGGAVTYLVTLESSGPTEVDVTLTGGDVARVERPEVWDDTFGAAGAEKRFAVAFTPKGVAPGAFEIRWKARAMVYGYCAAGERCDPKEAGHLTLHGVAPRPPR